jgi:hypothetical protein
MKILLSALALCCLTTTSIAAPSTAPQTNLPNNGTNSSLPNTHTSPLAPTRAMPHQSPTMPKKMMEQPAPTHLEQSNTKLDTISSKEINSADNDVSKKQYSEIVDAYKKYLATVKNSTREEIREYRKAIAKINKSKIELYKKLSQESQNFLAEERDFKKKLPIKHRHELIHEARSSNAE